MYPTDLKQNTLTYEFKRDYLPPHFENAGQTLKGSLLKECNDGWWQILDTNGKKIEGRCGPLWIRRALANGLIQEHQIKIATKPTLDPNAPKLNKRPFMGGSETAKEPWPKDPKAPKLNKGNWYSLNVPLETPNPSL